MAETPETNSLTKPELLNQLAASRINLQLDANRLRKDLSIATNLKRSVARRPGSWLSAAAIGGLILSLMPKGARRKSSRKARKRQLADQSDPVATTKRSGSGSTLITIIKLLLPIFKPAITTYATSRVASYVKNR